MTNSTKLPSFRLLKPHIDAHHDLIPLGRMSKVPAQNGWRNMTPMTYEEVEAHMKAGANVGVRLRPDQLVIDVDPRNGKGGSENPIVALLNRLGRSDSDWPVVSTGGGDGGRHYYLKKPGELLIRLKLPEFPGIEFKSEGAQMVASGSVHPETHDLYAVAPLQDHLADAPFAPVALLELITRPPTIGNSHAQLSSAQLSQCLSALDVKEFREHDRWLSLMMSCHHATGGQGRDVFIAWSISDPNHSEDEPKIGPRWDSLDLDKVGGVTAGTLFRELKNVGRSDLIELVTRVPAELDFEDDVAEKFVAPMALKIIKAKNGQPTNTTRNCIQLLNDCNLEMAYDELAQRPLIRAATLPWNRDVGREINDDLMRVIRLYMIERYGVEFSKDNVHEACYTLARMASFNPVVEYLDTLAWDGTKRLDRWLIAYLGAEDTQFNRHVGRLVLLAAVRRAKHPGAKFDQVLILEGPQGSGKSSALRILGGDWHSDAELGRVDSKEASILLQGAWLVELGEMTAMNRSETEALKAFLSRASDRFRAPFDRTPRTEPRRCVFIGTTNSEGYLRDITGNRRFWPVRTATIDLERLKRDRDQIWAEAVKLEAGEASIMLPPGLWADATKEQEARLVDDPWIDLLAHFLQAREVTRIHTRTLMTDALNLGVDRQTQHSGKRVRELMTNLGWSYRRSVRIDEINAAGYLAPGDSSSR
jgi:predicted P-loop ATPase